MALSKLVYLSAFAVLDYNLDQSEIPKTIQDLVMGKCYHCNAIIPNGDGKKDFISKNDDLVDIMCCKSCVNHV